MDSNRIYVLFIISLAFVITNCNREKKVVLSQGKIGYEVDYLLKNSDYINKEYFLPNRKDSSYIFIKLTDASCQLCAIDIDEINNLYNHYFFKKNITPIIILYGEVDPYVKEIARKERYKFPIYHISNKKYIEFLRAYDLKFDMSRNSIIINNNTNEVIYKGRPFLNSQDLKDLSFVINSIL